MNKQTNQKGRKQLKTNEQQKKLMATQTHINKRVKGLGSLGGYSTLASSDFYF